LKLLTVVILMKNYVLGILRSYNKGVTAVRITKYKKTGRKPWSCGYTEYKTEQIINVINSDLSFINKTLPSNYGYGLDERIVEYPWIFSKIAEGKLKILDAGSTFNFNFIVNHRLFQDKILLIYTFNPEVDCFHHKRISYIFGDLRDIILKDDQFDIVVSQSTIEHIGMNNSIYGHHFTAETNKNYEYIKVIIELIRVLKSSGHLLLTFPYGQYENHSFFQQFDHEMLSGIQEILKPLGIINETIFFKYSNDGWVISGQNEVDNCQSYNPHTGIGRFNDNAAHSRAVCCIDFIKD
jgi:hypothetical protein